MHAFEDIAGLYREELRSLREDAVRFAVRNPGMARQLGLASDTQPDPLVNLLLESFAWLAARVRADAESRLPLVSHSLLGLLYPQFVCPIPSVGVAEFIPNPAGVAGLPDGFGIPAHTPIHNRDERGGVLRWRTARPLTLHPAKVVRASIIPPASWMPAAAQGVPGVLCLRIEGIAGLSLAKFGLPSLSLHLGGDRFATFPMHEWVHGACKDVFLADDAGAAKPRALSLGREALCHAGLEPGGRLFPESAYALPGYQLLQEYFVYPEHLLFWEVGGLERRRELGDLPGFDLLFPVDAPPPKTVSSRLFRTCAVPVVNLFERMAEPIRVDHERSGHLLVPDLRHRDSTEVHSVIAVDALEGGERSSVMPYFSLSGEGDAPPSLMWFLRRKPSLDGIGTDVFLHFKEAGFRPETARPWVASARVLCTNRHRAAERWRQGELTRDTDMPTAAIRFCGPPSQQHDPPMFGGELWKLVSHLSLHQLSLSGPDADNVLRELLRLYAPPRDAFAQRQIAGVNGLCAKPLIRPLRSAPGCAARGTRLTLTLDEDAFTGGSAFLFAEVLDVFFGLYAGINTFTQLVLKTCNRKGTWHRWPLRSGALPLI